MRATRSELEALDADPSWWSHQLDVIRDQGSPEQLIGESAWSYGAFIGWVRSDESRSAAYDKALRDYGHRVGMAVVPLADGATPETVGVVKLQTDVRLKVAGKLSRERWGEKVDYIGAALDPLSELLREISERRQMAMRGVQSPVEKVVEQIPAEQVLDDEI